MTSCIGHLGGDSQRYLTSESPGKGKRKIFAERLWNSGFSWVTRIQEESKVGDSVSAITLITTDVREDKDITYQSHMLPWHL